MVLQTQQDEEVDILLHKVDTAFILDWRLEVLIGSEQDSLSHKDFYNVKARWVRVHVEADRVEDGSFLSDQLVFAAIEP